MAKAKHVVLLFPIVFITDNKHLLPHRLSRDHAYRNKALLRECIVIRQHLYLHTSLAMMLLLILVKVALYATANRAKFHAHVAPRSMHNSFSPSMPFWLGAPMPRFTQDRGNPS